MRLRHIISRQESSCKIQFDVQDVKVATNRNGIWMFITAYNRPGRNVAEYTRTAVYRDVGCCGVS